jgi:pyruvate/2-oxoacid:ferredoxin oxidoreductase beta subunit
MLDVKWKAKISKLSLDIRKEKIQKKHWRIGEFAKKARKAGKKKRVILRSRIYTPNTHSRLKQRLKMFSKTNEYGLTKSQVKQL